MRHICTVFVVLFSIITAAKASELGGRRSTDNPPYVSPRSPAGAAAQQGYDNAAFARELAELRKFCNGRSMADENYSCYCETPPREYDFGPGEGKVRLCERFYTWNDLRIKARKFQKKSTPQGPRICTPTVVKCKSNLGCFTIEGVSVPFGTEVGICV